MSNEYFEKLYDEIRDVTNKVGLECSPILHPEWSEKTKEMMEELINLSNAFATMAHEIEEHLAWD